MLPQLELSAATLDDVQSAVASGKEVTIHQRPMEVPGWSGAGYIVTDVETGAGAYLIEGGANGAYMGAFYTGLVTGIVIGVCVMTTLFLGPMLGWIYVALAALYIYALATLLVYRVLDVYVDDENKWNCYVGGLLLGFDVGNLPYPPGAVGALLITLLTGWYIDGNAKRLEKVGVELRMWLGYNGLLGKSRRAVRARTGRTGSTGLEIAQVELPSDRLGRHPHVSFCGLMAHGV